MDVDGSPALSLSIDCSAAHQSQIVFSDGDTLMQSTSEFGGLLDRQDHMRVSEAEHADAGLMRELALVFVASNSVAESSIYSVECIKKNQSLR